MKTNLGKIESLISQKRVKLHEFEPSQRKLWSVVGKEKEYWVEPTLNFCSCQSFYFNSIDDKQACYHLESLKIAQKEGKIEIIKFSDDEFPDFISGLISDL